VTNLYDDLPDGDVMGIDMICRWLQMSRSSFFRLRRQGTAPLKLVPIGRGRKGAPVDQVRAWYLGLGR
jgi:hypothetical protein